MTDLISSDLSHMSDADFNALCPQGHHAPGPEPLSPAAQAVFDAWIYPARFPVDKAGKGARKALAAALRAAADQANPKLQIEDISYQHQLYVDGWKDSLDLIIDIASELESQ